LDLFQDRQQTAIFNVNLHLALRPQAEEVNIGGPKQKE
jgi:hypothetical protein